MAARQRRSYPYLTTAVLGTITDQWEPSSVITKRLEQWEGSSVRVVLRMLAEEKKIENRRFAGLGFGRIRNEYRKIQSSEGTNGAEGK